MSRKKLPVPLILLIPLCLLVVVIVAGIYRFSMSDEEILAKFPSHQAEKADVVVETILGIKASNPWTVQVPETSAFSLLTDIDINKQVAAGGYDDGVDRGNVYLLYRFKQIMLENDKLRFAIVPFAVSNQGSGVFYYLGLFNWDEARQRVILTDAKLAGDRINIESLNVTGQKITLTFKSHGPEQSMAEAPAKENALVCTLKKGKLAGC
ncbi:hypothetical protein VTH8203_01955 [Vibrio thalassae]|uniref:Uncharacterized protein n=1 Tax=Vibrio thalassae TaxID=1243014 RepID=A0A240EI12_9VIBR|nr:hypothetical protein [Vibrio thalassae]SNX48337.1 hypothetical protein VTH8203_01955 [Vibrio thalassae]